jgi:hypothetical protein
MTEMEDDLSGVVLVTRTREVLHPTHYRPVLMVQTGWQRKGKVVWNDDVRYAEIEVEDV